MCPSAPANNAGVCFWWPGGFPINKLQGHEGDSVILQFRFVRLQAQAGKGWQWQIQLELDTNPGILCACADSLFNPRFIGLPTSHPQPSFFLKLRTRRLIVTIHIPAFDPTLPIVFLLARSCTNMGSIKTDANGHGSQLLHIDATFNNKNSEESAIELVYRIQPKWRAAPGKLEVVKFTDGITNTVRPLPVPIPCQARAHTVFALPVAQSRQTSTWPVPI